MRVAIPAMVLFVYGNIGLAAASDNAVPGDPLYPVDRAYENIAAVIGIDSDKAAERLAEASILLAEGNFAVAVEAIAASAAGTDDAIDDRIGQVQAELAAANPTGFDREDMHRSVAALASTVERIATGEYEPAAWMESLDASSQAVIDVAAGLPFNPVGQNGSFVPPGQDDNFVAPGQEDGSQPPGQDEGVVPPGRDEDRTPPGQENRGNEE